MTAEGVSADLRPMFERADQLRSAFVLASGAGKRHAAAAFNDASSYVC